MCRSLAPRGARPRGDEIGQTLYDTLVRETGASEDVSALARSWNRYGHLHVFARALAGTGEPSARPRLALEASTDGAAWSELLDLGLVGSEVVEGRAELAADNQLRVAWQLELPEEDGVRYWSTRVWVD
jgi:hypothetical protein